MEKAVGPHGPAENRAPGVVSWGERDIWDAINETPVASAPAEGISKEHSSVLRKNNWLKRRALNILALRPDWMQQREKNKRESLFDGAVKTPKLRT